jgi:hypothetical protein
MDRIRAKTIQNYNKIKFSTRPSNLNRWVDKVYPDDFEVQTGGWVDRLIEELPYPKEYINFVIDPTLINQLPISYNDIEDT